jgi:hypothetical protein
MEHAIGAIRRKPKLGHLLEGESSFQGICRYTFMYMLLALGVQIHQKPSKKLNMSGALPDLLSSFCCLCT